MIELLLVLLIKTASANTGIRLASGTSCERIRVNLGLGMTTQIVLEQEPKVILYADKKHFKITTNPASPRSLAIIPFLDQTEINDFRDSSHRLPTPIKLAANLDKSFKTNLFVIFDNNNQMMFDLRFVQKKKADYILKVTQVFNESCSL